MSVQPKSTNIQASRQFLFALTFAVAFTINPRLFAQVGNDNPTGPGGSFNGTVTTGCAYDPYTGNAVRNITDMVVAGAVGQYGLSYSRVWNTRTPGWQHSYQWGIEDITVPTGETPAYVVNFPDGRSEIFTYTSSDIYYRAAPGVRERLQPWSGTNGLCYLILPDGGKVEFFGTRTVNSDPELRPPNWYEYVFTATAIIDPYGQRTTLEYDADGNLKKVTEPAGRSIELFYTTVSGTQVIDYIKGSDNREVHYAYQSQTFSTVPYTLLTNVTYSSYYGVPEDPALTATYTYRSPNVGYANGYPLLSTCDDPMYGGAMKKINYTYKIGTNPDGTDAVYAQLNSEASINGIPVSTLAITDPNTRTETRGDGAVRTFTYTAGYLTSSTDFKGVPTFRLYDTKKYLMAITDERGHTTNFINNQLTGAVTQIQYPLTPGDTPPNTPRGSVIYTYGWANCPDPNNRDANNPYYLYSVKDEAGNETRFTRDSNKRIARIDYPDNAFETFTYNSFGQVLSHAMKTGGLETFTYDGRGLKQTYRDPDHATGNPTSRYQYDALDRLSGVTDALGSFAGDGGHTVNYVYNTRGQLRVTTLPIDPVDGSRHSLVNTYNSNGDGTLVAATDPLGHTTSYTYDDYRRIRSVATPQRFPGDSTPRTTYASYDTYQNSWDDYTHTDANITRLTLPSGKLIRTIYDANHRKISVTGSGADGVTDSSTTGFEYDEVGNPILIKEPDPQTGAASASRASSYNYDERNRPVSVADALSHATTFQYDAGGRKYMEQRPNGQTVTYNSYDPMNRLLQETVIQAPTGSAVTIYTWWPSGLLHTMQDPNGKVYTYEYDSLGRRLSLTYPPDSANVASSELYTYNQLTGHLETYTNRGGAVQTFFFDTLNRPTGFDWNDGYTPQQRTQYDAASRVTQIWNWDTTINFQYFDDNLLKTQQGVSGSVYNHTNTYAYDADGNRQSLTCPSTKVWQYTYNGRNQLADIMNANQVSLVGYQYDRAGNRTRRTLYNGTVTDYAPVDALNRSSWVRHKFNGTEVARFDYAFDEVSRLKYEQRDGGTADGYGYDVADQLTAFNRDGTLSNGSVTGGSQVTALSYDPAGNRAQVTTNGTTTAWSVNNLNEYTSANGAPVGSDAKGNVQTYNGWTYIYDAQNRLRNAYNGTTTLEFWYDGLNRQIARRFNGNITRSVWDGWNLLEELDVNDAPVEYYLHGARTDELVVRWGGAYGDTWYAQDGRGNTSHLFDYGGIVERYTYSLAGEPKIFDGSSIVQTESPLKNRFMFTGREYYKEGGIYDYRNRFYHPSLGRFLQSDPLGFGGGDANLYRYCGGDSVNRSDPYGLLWGLPSTVAGGGIGAVVGTYGGFLAGLTNQGISYSQGNGFSWSTVGTYTWHGTVIGVIGGMVAGSFATFDPASYAATALMAATLTGPATGMMGDHGPQTPPPVPASQPAAPSGPFIPPPSVPGPDGFYHDANGNALANLGSNLPGLVYSGSGWYNVSMPDPSSTTGFHEFVVGFSDTIRDPATGDPWHFGSTGNLIDGSAFGIIENIPGLISFGGQGPGGWQTAGYFPSGGLPGEGTHPVAWELR